jgi:hypothetical protein
MPIPALAPVVSPLLEEEVAVGLAAEELTVTAIDEVLDAMDVEVMNSDEAGPVVFGFCWVTVRLGRMKYP